VSIVDDQLEGIAPGLRKDLQVPAGDVGQILQQKSIYTIVKTSLLFQ
jgi:hypothetical protein